MIHEAAVFFQGAALALVGLGKHTVQLLPIVALALMEISTHGVYVGPKQSVTEMIELIKTKKVVISSVSGVS